MTVSQAGQHVQAHQTMCIKCARFYRSVTPALIVSYFFFFKKACSQLGCNIKKRQC